MMKQIISALVLSVTFLILAACGDSTTHTNTSATFKVNLTDVELTGKPITGVSFTISLPAHVTAATNNGAIADNVVVPSDTFVGGSFVRPPVYNATSGTITVDTMINRAENGVAAGKIAAISLQLANNAAPSSEQFVFSNVVAIDTTGNQISGITAKAIDLTLQ